MTFMMRNCFLLAGLLFSVSGCDQKPASREEAATADSDSDKVTPAPVPQPGPQAFAAADTATPYSTLKGFGHSVQMPAHVKISGRTYQLQINARVDSTQKLSYTYPPDPGLSDTTQSNTVTGYEGIYTFRLLRPDGKPQFVRELKNSDFKSEVGEGLAVELDTTTPVFTGYLPAFNALAFELNFNPPESDSGGYGLLLLDATTGRVIHKTVASWNAGCNSPPALSADGRTLLTSFEIIQANGRITKFGNKPGRMVAGTLLVNNQTVLVVYVSDNDQDLKGPNAELMDLNGRRLAGLKLMSIDGGLGYQMETKYVGQTRTHYLFDEQNRKICLISADKPSPVLMRKLDQLTKFKPPQRPTEVRVYFDTETGTRAAFYTDTLTGKLRYWLKKPVY